MEQERTKTQFRNIACFFILGYLMVFLKEVVSAASVDMFAGSPLAMEAGIHDGRSSEFTVDTAAVVTGGFAHILVKLTLPWVAQKVSYRSKVFLVVCLYSTGLVIILVANSPVARLIGVVAFESGSAAAEVTFLSLTAFYGGFAVNSLLAGGGLGFSLGSMYYAGISTWTCVSPRIAVAVIAPSVCCFIIFYAILERDQQSQNTTFKGVRYSALQDKQEERETYECNIVEKFMVSWNIFMPMTYLFLQYFADHISLQVLIAPLAYPHKALYPIGYFSYYALAHNMGKLVGRSYLLAVSITCSSVVSHVQIKNTWLLAAVGNALMFVFVFASWFRFVEEIGVIIILCFLVGFTTESNYANSSLFVHEQTDVSRREFALGILTLGSSAGMFAAGLLGLFLRPYLMHHCLFELKLGKNCLPWFSHLFGWMRNVYC